MLCYTSEVLMKHLLQYVLSEDLERHLIKAYLMFLSDILPIINAFNKLMQCESPTIQYLHQELHSFVRKLLLRFMLTIWCKVLIKLVIMAASNYKALLNAVSVGEKAKVYIQDCTDLSPGDVKIFQEKCRNYWLEAVKYAVKKLHLDNGIIKNIHWIQPCTQDYNMIDEVLALAT